MSAEDFNRFPSVEFLRYLAGDSLRQLDVLSMAVRLWVMRRSLYGADTERAEMFKPINYETAKMLVVIAQLTWGNKEYLSSI